MKALLIVLLLGVVTFGYPDAPGSCTLPSGEMGTSPADSSNGGYTVDGLPTEYAVGETYSLTLRGATNQFKGFILHAEDANGDRVGIWRKNTGDTRAANVLLGCNGGSDATLGHTQDLSDAPTDTLVISWTAPENGVGAVTFSGVAVRSTTTWYILTDQEVDGPGAPPVSTTEPSDPSGAPFTTFAALVAFFAVLLARFY
eukprot:TRINITY_DN130_c0_g1_i1.p1 TRINITY_DN130_c0_g1~~TRINITY_DN130_c0_g1_i1.p1  ORF type:complete len:200 (+),score=27.47 TRINITY_DN130_c0_g1_i1:137-736(+)